MSLTFNATTGELISGGDDLASAGYYVQGSIGANFDLSKVTAGTYDPTATPTADFLTAGTAINISLTGSTSVNFGDNGANTIVSPSSGATSIYTQMGSSSGANNIAIATGSNDEVVEWLAKNPGYDEVHIRGEAHSISDASDPTDGGNTYTVSLVAKGANKSDQVLAYSSVAGDKIATGGTEFKFDQLSSPGAS